MTITLKHTLTGIVADYPDGYDKHPVFGEYLEHTDQEAHCVDCEVPAPAVEIEPDTDTATAPAQEYTIEAIPAFEAPENTAPRKRGK